jgi:hypothetical protein
VIIPPEAIFRIRDKKSNFSVSQLIRLCSKVLLDRAPMLAHPLEQTVLRKLPALPAPDRILHPRSPGPSAAPPTDRQQQPPHFDQRRAQLSSPKNGRSPGMFSGHFAVLDGTVCALLGRQQT